MNKKQFLLIKIYKKGKIDENFFSSPKFVTHFSVSLEEIGGNKHRRKEIRFFVKNRD